MLRPRFRHASLETRFKTDGRIGTEQVTQTVTLLGVGAKEQ